MDSTIRVRNLASGLVALALCLAIHSSPAAQEGQQPPAMSPEEKVMMEKWTAFMTPGAEHQLLAQRAGSWTMRVTMWAAPGAPPQVSEGTSESRMIMGGRYLEDVSSSTFNGMPFEGRGFSGYDNFRKTYFFTWIDNMGTGVMVGHGTYDSKKKAFASVSEAPDMMTGKVKKVRGVDAMIDSDHWKSEMYDKTADGKEFKMMEIDYKRKK
jgi:hypothetical protein